MDEIISRSDQYLSAIANGKTDVPQPTTRYERYLYALANGSKDVPEPKSRIDEYLYAICTGKSAVPVPVTRNEKYLYAIATGDTQYGLPAPKTRNEYWLNIMAGGDAGGGEEAPGDWAAVFKAIKDGSYKDKYEIGQTIPLDLGSEGVVNMQIVAFDADDLADGSGKAAITWISKELLKTQHRVNIGLSQTGIGVGMIGGWENCEIRAYLKETIKPLIPEPIIRRIAEVLKYSDSYTASGSRDRDMMTTDDVFIPSSREISAVSNVETKGPVYSGVFSDDTSRIKINVDTLYADIWCTRSSYDKSAVRGVNKSGSARIDSPELLWGVALGFCT